MYPFALARVAPLTHRRQLPLTGQRLFFSRLSHPADVFFFLVCHVCSPSLPSQLSTWRREAAPSAMAYGHVEGRSVLPVWLANVGAEAAAAVAAASRTGFVPRLLLEVRCLAYTVRQVSPLSLDTIISFFFYPFVSAKSFTFPPTVIFRRIFRIPERAIGNFYR